MKPLFAILALLFAHCSPSAAASLPPGFAAVKDAAIDAATGLPKQIVHEASGVRFVLIPAGEFMMGSSEDEPDRGKGEQRHRRAIRKPFYLGATEVTSGQFRRFVTATKYQTDAERGSADGAEKGRGAFAMREVEGDRQWHADASWHNPFPNLKDTPPRDDYPVVQVSWNDAQAFCAHFKMRLPTEAEWEFACRAGSASRYPWGDNPADGKGYCNVVDASAKRRFDKHNLPFPFDDGASVVSTVGRYKPNAWGLDDTIGNVEEFCQDAYGRYPTDTADESATPGRDNAARVMRGGSFLDHPGRCRSAMRSVFAPTSRRDFIGFRVAVSIVD